MKKCPTCKKEKDTESFYKRGDELPQSKCKDCFNKYCHDRWIRRKLHAIEKLGGKCTDCKKSFHYAAYDFHHLRDKDVGWEKLRKMSQEKIDRELEKCILLCANCHRVRHASIA